MKVFDGIFYLLHKKPVILVLGLGCTKTEFVGNRRCTL